LAGWTSKHGELAIRERDDGRSLAEENRQLEHLVAGLSLEKGYADGWKEERLDLVPWSASGEQVIL